MSNTTMPDVMGFMYIKEDVSPIDNKPTNLQVIDKPSLFYVQFDATMQSFGVMNRNNRMYEIDNVWNCIVNDPKIQDLLKNSGWFGEMDHPNAEKKGEELSAERILNPAMGNTSHKIMNPTRSGNLINATIQTDAGTSAGINMAKKILQGMTPRFSARAVAELVNKNGVPVVNMKKLITYDWVLYPSHVEAHALTKPKVVNTVCESAQDDGVTYTMILPLKEILEYAGKKCVNSRVIMESFELDADSLVGFDRNCEHIIMKDNDNLIFSKMDSKVRKEVNGYLSKM